MISLLKKIGEEREIQFNKTNAFLASLQAGEKHGLESLVFSLVSMLVSVAGREAVWQIILPDKPLSSVRINTAQTRLSQMFFKSWL